MDKIERRSLTRKVEVRAQSENGKLPIIAGHAAVFNEICQYPIWNDFYELIMPGAFTRALQDPATDVVACCYHKEELWLPLARMKNLSGTLKLWEDEIGLAFEFEPADTSLGRDAVVSLQRGDIDSMSFGFRAQSDNWNQSHEGLPLRRVIEASIFDISLAITPYYAGAKVGARSINSRQGDMLQEDYRDVIRNNVISPDTASRARRLRLIELTNKAGGI